MGGSEHSTWGPQINGPFGGCCRKDRTSRDYTLAPKAAVTKNHKEGGVKSQQCVLLGSGGQRSGMKVQTPLGGSKGESSGAFLLASAAGRIFGV